MAVKNAKMVGKLFWQKVAAYFVYALRVKNFVEITLPHTVSEINTFLYFTQKFNMAAKSGGKKLFSKKLPVDSADTQWVKNFIEIAVSHSVSKINSFLHITQKFKTAGKIGGKTVFGKSCH